MLLQQVTYRCKTEIIGKLNSYTSLKLEDTHLNCSKIIFLGFGHAYNYVPPISESLATLPIAIQGHDGWGLFFVP